MREGLRVEDVAGGGGGGVAVHAYGVTWILNWR